MEGYGSSIFWLETAPAPIRPALDGGLKVDVAIVGGGFLGLWTAATDQRVAVVVVDKFGCGRP